MAKRSILGQFYLEFFKFDHLFQLVLRLLLLELGVRAESNGLLLKISDILQVTECLVLSHGFLLIIIIY